MEQKRQEPIQGTLFPEFEEQVAVPKPSPKTAKQKKEELQDENQQLRESLREKDSEIEQLKKEIASLKVKAEAFDDLLNSNSLFPIGIIAKNFGRTAIWLNQYLESKKVQYKRGKIWMLYSKYDNCGYTRVCWYDYSEDSKGRPLSKAHTYWTAKGMVFIRELLIKDGLLKD